MEDDAVDMIFTSPPFKDEDVNGDYWTIYEKWFNEMKRVTKNVLIIIHSSTKMLKHLKNFPPKRILIWGKIPTRYSYRWNPIYIYQLNDNYKINKFIWGDLFGVAPLYDQERGHKYQDPIMLYTCIIRMFRDNNLIYDPFMGGGTTAIASIKENRQWIGSEISKEFYKIAQKQIDNELNQTRLF